CWGLEHDRIVWSPRCRCCSDGSSRAGRLALPQARARGQPAAQCAAFARQPHDKSSGGVWNREPVPSAEDQPLLEAVLDALDRLYDGKTTAVDVRALLF